MDGAQATATAIAVKATQPEPEDKLTRKQKSFRAVLFMFLSLICVELILSIALPMLTSRIRERTRSTLALMRSRMPSQADDLDDLLPPSVGSLYVLQGPSSTFSRSVDNLRRLRLLLRQTGTDSGEVERFLRGFNGDEINSMLALVHNRTGEFHAIEPGLVSLLATNGATQDLVKNDLEVLFGMGITAEDAGMVDDARLDFQQFLANANLASQKMSDIATDIDLQKEMSLATVRVKLLAQQHVFRWEAFRALDSADVDQARQYLGDQDQAIREMALFTVTADEFKSGKLDDAYARLHGHVRQCGAIRDECEYLLARMHARRWFIRRLQEEGAGGDPEEAIRLFRAFLARVGTRHYLADDSYLSMATTMLGAGDHEKAVTLARDGLTLTHGDTTLALEEFLRVNEHDRSK